MRTIAQALKDETGYPFPDGFIANRLLSRSLDGDAAITAEVLQSDPFKGSVADCLMALLCAPNVTEADISVSLGDREAILKRANALYASIGEPEREVDRPRVRIGWE